MLRRSTCIAKSWFLFSLMLVTPAWARVQAKTDSSQASPSVIRFSASNSWSEPFAIYDKKKNLRGGVVKDLMDALANKMGKKPVYITLPRKVVDAATEKGRIDVRCYSIESWVKDPSLMEWSKPLFDIVNVIGFSKDAAPIRKVEDLKGKTVGTVLGYKYPTIEKYFEDQSVKRSDASSETANIQKLLLGRIQYAIVEASEFDWYMKQKQAPSFDAKTFFEIERYPVKCGVLKTSQTTVQELDQAIDKLRQEGFFKKLMSKYGIR